MTTTPHDHTNALPQRAPAAMRRCGSAPVFRLGAVSMWPGVAPPPDPTPTSHWTPALLVAPLVLLLAAFGLWMVWGGRLAPVGRDPDASPWRAVRWRDRLTEASRLSIGLAALFVAYHALSYALPDGWLPFRIPPEKWYLLAIGVLLLVGGSLATDRIVGGDASPADGGGHQHPPSRDERTPS